MHLLLGTQYPAAMPYIAYENKADRPLTLDTLNDPWLLTNRQFQWTANGHSQFLISTCSAPLVQTGECKQTIFHWPWPTIPG